MSDVQNGRKQAPSTLLRQVPAVDRLLSDRRLIELTGDLPHDVVASAVRQELDSVREAVTRGALSVPDTEELAERAGRRARLMASPSLRKVINATGVILHTNLGRAPLSRSAAEAIVYAASYSNLEYRLEEGERGSRYDHAVGVLRRIAGAEDGLIVNNNAAALVLVLAAFASGKEVILSRSQAVEIGGGFRIPDVMRQSGARLVEVGTTNRTYSRDYEEAITEQSAAIMRVHASNFRIVGFTTSPGTAELAEVAHSRNLLMIDDIGSGALLPTERYGLAPEPLVQNSLRDGADLVLFSGDKLLGGPQCGIIAGRAPAVAALKKHPLTRALRVDKLTLAALEATLLHYLKGEAEREVPVWRMISEAAGVIRERAARWQGELSAAGVECNLAEGQSAIGGGSLPGETLPTWLVSVTPHGPEEAAEAEAGRLAYRLRTASLPVIARVEKGAVLLDPRTVDADEEELLLATLRAVYRP